MTSDLLPLGQQAHSEISYENEMGGGVPVTVSVTLLRYQGPASCCGSVCLCSSSHSGEQIEQVRGRRGSLIIMLLLNYLLDKHVIIN